MAHLGRGPIRCRGHRLCCFPTPSPGSIRRIALDSGDNGGNQLETIGDRLTLRRTAEYTRNAAPARPRTERTRIS